jgi:hypothetical protein
LNKAPGKLHSSFATADLMTYGSTDRPLSMVDDDLVIQLKVTIQATESIYS